MTRGRCGVRVVARMMTTTKNLQAPVAGCFSPASAQLSLALSGAQCACHLRKVVQCHEKDATRVGARVAVVYVPHLFCDPIEHPLRAVFPSSPARGRLVWCGVNVGPPRTRNIVMHARVSRASNRGTRPSRARDLGPRARKPRKPEPSISLLVKYALRSASSRRRKRRLPRLADNASLLRVSYSMRVAQPRSAGGRGAL